MSANHRLMGALLATHAQILLGRTDVSKVLFPPQRQGSVVELCQH